MKHWNDLDNVVIIDTNSAGDLLVKLKENPQYKGNELGNKIIKKQFSIINVPGFREGFSTNSESILKILARLKEYAKIYSRPEYLSDLSKKCSHVKDEFSSDKDFDDQWIVAKVLSTFPKNKLYLITKDTRFIDFLDRNSNSDSVKLFKKNCHIIFYSGTSTNSTPSSLSTNNFLNCKIK